MTKAELALPEIGIIAVTRALLGAGVGLLASTQLSAGHRKTVGWTLLAIGVASTIPPAMDVFGKRH